MTINDVIRTAVANLQRQFPALSFEYLYGQILIAVLLGIGKTSTTSLARTIGFIDMVREKADSAVIDLLATLFATAEATVILNANGQYLNELTNTLVPALANEESVAILAAFEAAAQGTDYEALASGIANAIRMASDRAAEGLDPLATREEAEQAAPLYLGNAY